MKLNEKLELVNASIKLADFWGIEVKEMLSFTGLIHKEKSKEWNKLATEVLEFRKLPIEKRAKKMGFKIIKNKK